MKPLITIPNTQGDDFGIIEFNDILASPFASLLAGVALEISIPSGAKVVRFAYAQSGGNVYVSPDTVVVPGAGLSIDSRAETNPNNRHIADLINEGIDSLKLLSDVDMTVHLYFYTR